MLPETHADHLEKLELKIMDLENTVQALHEVLLKQYQDMDELKARINRLDNRLSAAAQESAGFTPQDERPPHY